ncbi:DNA polymerase III subunit gamma and tau [Dactylosporangium sp. NPDC000521]|uniref:DNA polymerase III subunit gamma and tau n=1 Tax=Dactylosporangium sp. NPDC000521 TaxID=3363975 RepID=UPI0036B6D6A2
MALALYRKYRPRTFAEVIGQEHVTEPLSQALRSGRLNHAYLFSGPRGCGKTSSARILARSLNCEKGPTPDPCGECDSCRALAPDGAGSIDVIEIDAASHGGVDDARDLRERAFFAPVSSRFKVYVIDEAHMVSSAGFNALLKLVEEPPEYVKFVFATTEPEKVLGTIKSRTHHYPFRLIPPGVLRPYLEQLTTSEGVKVEPAVFPLVVRAGAGSARDSLSVLDQLISGAGPDGVTYQRAVALLGVTDVALIDEMCDSLAADDGRGAYGVIDRVVEAGHDPRRFASDLLERLRDLIVLQQVPDAVAKGLLDAPHDQLERMGAQATQLGQATLSRYADIVHNGLTEMRGTTAPRLLLELITARMLLPGADDSGSALLQRLERMERRLLAGGAVPAPAAAPVSGPASGSASGAGHGSAPAAAPTSGAGHAPAPAAGPASGGGHAPGPAAGPSSVPAGPASQAGPAAAQAGPFSAAAGPAAAAAGYGSAPGAGAEPVAHASEQVAAGHSYGAPQPSGGGAPVAYEPAASPVPPQGVGALDAGAVRRVWTDVLSLVSGKSKKAAAIVREATVQDVEGTTLVLGFKHTAHANMLNASPDVLIAALSELLGGRWQVRCEVGGQPGGGGGGTRPTPPRPTPSGPGGAPPGGQAPGGGPGFGGPSGGGPGSAAVPQQAAEAWPTPARPAGEPVPVDARAGGSSGAFAPPGGPSMASPGGPSGAFASPGGPSQAGDGWPTPAAVPGTSAHGTHATTTVQAPHAGPGGGHPVQGGHPAPAGHAGAQAPAGGAAAAHGGAPAPRGSAAAHGGASASQSDGQAGWPTPAVPGGAAQPDGWPATAVPGGVVRTPSGGALADPRGLSGGSAGGDQMHVSGGGWPAIATPGGSGQGGQGQASEWPATATPGGSAAGGSAAGGSTPGGSAQVATRQPGAGQPAGASPNGGGLSGAGGGQGANGARTPGGARQQNGARPRSAIEQAREAASRAANAPRRAAAAPVVESAWEGAGADEPPYDPEYDRPVADPRFPGLDPGDELLDDATSVRESSEEAALRLLSEALGAEKIGETTS